MLTALILNERQSCELVIVAPTKEVANNSFDPMKDMIRVDKELSAIFNVSGDLVVVEHVGDDVAQFADIARKLLDSGKLDKIGLDQAGADDIVIALESIGIPKDKIMGISQGWRLGGYQKVCERKLASGDLFHASQPLMAWCVGNARVKLSGSGVLMSKSESGNGKIDPVIAMLNAVALMSQNPSPPKSADDVGVYF